MGKDSKISPVKVPSPATEATKKDGSPDKNKKSSPTKDKESTSKEGSPDKTKTPEQYKEEADALLAAGKRDLLLSNIPEAVSNCAKACELMDMGFGETAHENAEFYFYYGKSLLELSRMESGVLGHALVGVPEEESENNTSQFEDPAKLSAEEKTEVSDNVTDALEENFEELEKKKSEAKDSTSKTEETKEGSVETKKTAEAMDTDDTNEGKKADGAAPSEDSKEVEKADDASKVEKKADTDSKEEKKGEEESMDEGTEEEGETGEEADAEDSQDEKEDPSNESKEEPSNLQLAWEMLEVAKVVYSKMVTENKEDLSIMEKLCCTLCLIGEVSIENENYKQAVEDFQDCLKRQEKFAKDSRCTAETHYQLGVALGYHGQFDEAVPSLKSAISIIQERIGNKEKEESEDAKKEVTELKALVPEIEEKIKDTEDMKKEAEKKKATEGASGDAFKSDAKDSKPVTSIAVKRKASEDEGASNKKVVAGKETAGAS